MPAARAGVSRSQQSGGTVGGRFVLEDRVHASAHAEVWRARDSDGARVAVKLARSGPEARARLRAEHAWLARLEHAAILRPLAWIDAALHTALVAEYIDGGDLVSLAGAAPRHWLRPLAEVAEALAYLHARSVVHRDVKARNVRVDSAGHARLIDFGSAAEIGSPRTVGSTTAEHRFADSGTISPADDVFAFAVLLYELMAGRLPFGAEPVRPRRVAAPPLVPDLRKRPMLAALEAQVQGVLHAKHGAEAGGMRAFRDGLKSALTEESARQ
ncbi:MAG TPA: protein kinase [Gammaproteobacteria bacterium]